MATPRTRFVNTASTSGGTGNTNDTAGADRAYASLNECLTNEGADSDLVANDQYLLIYCCGAAADALQGWITGWTTDATRFVRIEGNPWHANGRHPGRWSTSHYRISCSEAFGYGVLVESPFTQLVGIQIENVAANADNALLLATGVAGDSGNDDCLCDALIVRGNTTSYGGTVVVQVSGAARWHNCVFYGGDNSNSGFYAAYGGPGRADADLYHCVSANNEGPGFSSSSASNDVNCTNCYAGGNGGDDFVGGGLIAGTTDCASEDGLTGTTVAYSTSAGAYFTNITPGSEDFHIGAASSLRGLGSDQSAVLARGIDGAKRVAWDVGADEYDTDLGDSFDVDSLFDWSLFNRGNIAYVRDAANGELDVSGADNDARLAYMALLGLEHEAQATVATGASRTVVVGVRMNDEAADAYGIQAQAGQLTLVRFNASARTILADWVSAYTSGNFLSVRLKAEGGNGSNVVLSVWIQDHGASKPSDPGWLSGSPTQTYTDTDAARLDDSAVHLSPGIAGRGPVSGGVDTRTDFWRARALAVAGDPLSRRAYGRYGRSALQ